MKKYFSIQALVILRTIIFSCKDNSDHFVEKRVICNHAEYGFTITKRAQLYNVRVNRSDNDLILERKADEVLSIVSGIDGNYERIGTFRYDKPKKKSHLFITEVVSKETRTEEICKRETK